MEQIMDIIKKRRSVRSYKDTPLPQRTINSIMEAARYAPSARNLQQLEYKVITNKALMRSISAGISAALKKDFGKHVTFWGGGCDPRVLTTGTPEEVRRDVRKRIADFHPNGGFVFASVHNVQANDPPENIIAMYETAKEYK